MGHANDKNKKSTRCWHVGSFDCITSACHWGYGLYGFTALQLKAVDATDEAMSKIEAMNIARDVAERIRVNRGGLATYVDELNKTTQTNITTSGLKKCLGDTVCTGTEMAKYDTAQIVSRAQSIAMQITLPNCQVVGAVDRICIYIAWGDTKPINHATDKQACTSGGTYLPEAKCIVMELY